MITKSKKSLLFLYTVIILLLVVVSFINISDNHSSEKSPKETIERTIIIIRKVKKAHIQRLQDGECTPSLSFMFSDLLTDYRRIAAHCGNIAISILQLKDSTLGKHQYNHRDMDEEEENKFKSKYKDYKSKFSVSKESKEK